jgi:hypothetical protein
LNDNRAKLNLEILEDRNAPGEASLGMMAPLIGLSFLDPLTSMASIVGENALLGAESPEESSTTSNTTPDFLPELDDEPTSLTPTPSEPESESTAEEEEIASLPAYASPSDDLLDEALAAATQFANQLDQSPLLNAPTPSEAGSFAPNDSPQPLTPNAPQSNSFGSGSGEEGENDPPLSLMSGPEGGGTIEPPPPPPLLDAVDDSYSSVANGQAATLSVLENDTGYTAISSFTSGTQGTVSQNGDQLVYTPTSWGQGSDSFTYTITNGQGNFDTATVTIGFQLLDAVDDDYAADAGHLNEYAVLDNDTGYSHISSFTYGTKGKVQLGTGGKLNYYALHGATGADQFTYTITDGQGNYDTATVQVDFGGGGGGLGPLEAIGDVAYTEINDPVTIQVLSNDIGSDGTIVSTTPTTHGTLSISGGAIIYTPDQDYTGRDYFTYTITDGQGNYDTAGVKLFVDEVGPIAIDDQATTDEDVAVTIDVLANDLWHNGTIVTVDGAVNGTVSVVGNQVVYTPNTDYFGSELLVYTITDGQGEFSSALVDIEIVPIGLHAVDDQSLINEDTTVDIEVLANDHHHDGTIVSFTNPSHGSVTFTGGIASYTPDRDYVGDDQFTYTITDGLGLYDTAVVYLEIDETNPVAVDDVASTNEDQSILIDVLANDSGHDGSVLSVTAAANGLVQIIGSQIQYTPDQNYFGSDSFTYTITDGGTETSTATVYVDIRWDSTQLRAVNDLGQTTQNQTVTVAVMSNDIGGTGITAVTEAAHGIASVVGTSIEYTPDTDFRGIDSFEYTITDGQGHFSTALIEIIVGGNAGAPAQVFFAINKTFDIRDDVLSIEAGSTPIDIYLDAPGLTGPQLIELLVPSGKSAFAQTQISLEHGESIEVLLTPLLVSSLIDDILLEAYASNTNGPGGNPPQQPNQNQKLGDAKETNIKGITFTTVEGDEFKNHIRGASSPAAMADRIAPRVDTQIKITVDGPQLNTDTANRYFYLTVMGENDANGKVKLTASGGYQNHRFVYVNFTSFGNDNTYIAKARGDVDNVNAANEIVWQTKPGNAGNLKLNLSLGATWASSKTLKESFGFSVSAIPVAVKFTSVQQLIADRIEEKDAKGKVEKIIYAFGVSYKGHFLSDSEISKDLDQVQVSELIYTKDKDKTGGLEGAPDKVGQFFAGNLAVTDLVASAISLTPDQERKIFDAVTKGLSDEDANKFGPRLVRQFILTEFKKQFMKFPSSTSKSSQLFVFADQRVGMKLADALPILNSGFILQKEIIKDTSMSVERTPSIVTLTGKIKVPNGEITLQNVTAQKGLGDPPVLMKQAFDLRIPAEE